MIIAKYETPYEIIIIRDSTRFPYFFLGFGLDEPTGSCRSEMGPFTSVEEAEAYLRRNCPMATKVAEGPDFKAHRLKVAELESQIHVLEAELTQLQQENNLLKDTLTKKHSLIPSGQPLG